MIYGIAARRGNFTVVRYISCLAVIVCARQNNSVEHLYTSVAAWRRVGSIGSLPPLYYLPLQKLSHQ